MATHPSPLLNRRDFPENKRRGRCRSAHRLSSARACFFRSRASAGEAAHQSLERLGAHHSRQSRHADSRQVRDGPGHHDRAADDSRGRALSRLEARCTLNKPPRIQKSMTSEPAEAAASLVPGCPAPGRRRCARNAHRCRREEVGSRHRHLHSAERLRRARPSRALVHLR